MGIRSGEAAGAAAVSAPSDPDCGGDRQWRGQGAAAEGGGKREGAEEGRSWSAKAGSGEMGEESLWGEAAREGDESWRRRERRVRGGGGRGEAGRGQV